MARVKLKLNSPVTAIDFDVDKHSLESNGWARIVRCEECKYWSEVDTSDGLRYGQCDRPGSAIRGNCFIRESWFCADGEMEVQE